MTSFTTAGGGGALPPTSLESTLGYGRWGGGVNNPTATKYAACANMTSLPTGSIATVLNVTGKGIIQFIMLTNPYAGYTIGPSTLTIDGILVSTMVGFNGLNNSGFFAGSFSPASNANATAGPMPTATYEAIPFNTGFSVDSGSSGSTGYIFYKYYLT